MAISIATESGIVTFAMFRNVDSSSLLVMWTSIRRL